MPAPFSLFPMSRSHTFRCDTASTLQSRQANYVYNVPGICQRFPVFSLLVIFHLFSARCTHQCDRNGAGCRSPGITNKLAFMSKSRRRSPCVSEQSSSSAFLDHRGTVLDASFNSILGNLKMLIPIFPEHSLLLNVRENHHPLVALH